MLWIDAACQAYHKEGVGRLNDITVLETEQKGKYVKISQRILCI